MPSNTTSNASFHEELKREVFDFAFAVHRVTELFPKEEVLRKELREHSTGLLTTVSGLEFIGSLEKPKIMRNVLSGISALKSLILLSQRTGLMKVINGEVLAKECLALDVYFQYELDALKREQDHDQNSSEHKNKEIARKPSKVQNDTPISDIKISINPALKNGMSFLRQNSKKKILKMQDFMSNDYFNSNETIGVMPFSSDGVNNILGTQKQPIRETMIVNRAPGINDTKEDCNGGGSANSSNLEVRERHGAIIDYLKANGEAKTAELTTIFSNRFSVKTLQRDLARLITSGNVLRQGDKRWAVYRINDKLESRN
ncbi:MAG: hypothetical protein Q7S66_05560 [bacterium]|nr:hypothetical protein [bacterium]